MTDHTSAPPWLEGSGPARGRLARARIFTAQDIDKISAVAPDDVLPGATIYECIRTAARENPNKPAIVHLLAADTLGDSRTVAYAQLVDLIERAASTFHEAAGPQPSSVGIILPMVPEALIAMWGAATAGIATPINPYLELEQIASLLNAARATVLVTGCAEHGRGAWEKLDQISRRVPTLRRILIVDSKDPADNFLAVIGARSPGLSFVPLRDPDGEATYLPTGGTTDAPKLVRMTHRGQLLMAWLIGAHAGAARDDVVGHAMPNFHVGGANLLALRAALYGQTLVTLTIDGFRNPRIVQEFWRIVRHHRITSLIATPATAAAILAQPGPAFAEHDVRVFNCGGSTIPVEVLRGFHDRFGVWLREIWGMSECHGMVSIHSDLGVEPVVGSVGRAVPWHRIKVVELDDANRFVRECAAGERGALVVSGAALAPGYVDTRFDSEFFVTDMPDGGRWGNTGDLGAMDEQGYVWIFGRAKDVIIRGGHNIDPKLIEDVLVRHPAVQIAAAVGRPDAAKGEMPIAYVQLKPGMAATAEELLALSREQVQERAAVPVEVIIVAQIPTTAVGKVNKPVLRAETTLRVALEQATAVTHGRDKIEVRLDESTVRRRVILDVRTNAPDATALLEELRSAFRNYEFETLISVSPGDDTVGA